MEYLIIIMRYFKMNYRLIQLQLSNFIMISSLNDLIYFSFKVFFLDIFKSDQTKKNYQAFMSLSQKPSLNLMIIYHCLIHHLK